MRGGGLGGCPPDSFLNNLSEAAREGCKAATSTIIAVVYWVVLRG